MRREQWIRAVLRSTGERTVEDDTRMDSGKHESTNGQVTMQHVTQHWAGANRAVLDTARALLGRGQSFALALVLQTTGSTYRKPGALALVADDGRRVGVISGGCLESMLEEAAAAVLAADAPRTLTIDTRTDDDLIFGSGSGCRGQMRVLLSPVRPQRPNPLYDTIDHAASAGLALQLQFDERHAQDGSHLAAGFAGEACSLRLSSPRRILLIGAGPECLPLLRFASSLGWRVTLVDHRPAVLQTAAAEADVSLLARPEAALTRFGEQSFDAALVMTHTAQADLEALRALAVRDEPFVGLLGPAARRDELLQQLDAAQRAALLPRLHAPIGIRLGGDGPEPLALSIAAELQRHFHTPP